jgi:amino acid transporter
MLPATTLLDEGRGRALAPAILALAAAGAALALIVNWMDDPPAALGKAASTVAVAAVAGAQISALVVLRRDSDPRIVSPLFVASTILAVAVTGMIALVVWAEIDDETWARILTALIVLDVLAAGLQPILARARAAGIEAHLRITTMPGGPGELTVSGRDLASAVATAIRGIEAGGRRVRSIEVVEHTEAPPGATPLPRD